MTSLNQLAAPRLLESVLWVLVKDLAEVLPVAAWAILEHLVRSRQEGAHSRQVRHPKSASSKLKLDVAPL